MLEDHHKLLYPDCQNRLKKLGTTLELLQWKATNGVSDKGGFGELLKLVKKMLPKDNKLPVTTYEAKQLVCPLGLEVQKIHACPNDFIDFIDPITCNWRLLRDNPDEIFQMLFKYISVHHNKQMILFPYNFA